MDLLNKIYNEDCLTFLPKIPDNSIDLVVTSPPYNLGIDYDAWEDNMTWDKYYAWCKIWLKEIYRVLKDDGRFCLNHYFSLGRGAEKLGNKLERHTPLMDLNWISVNEIGFKHHSVAFWTDITLSKRSAWGSWLSASAPYINAPLEGILILYKNQWKKKNKGISTIDRDMFMKATSGIWNLGTVKKSPTPAGFPEKLAEYCIQLLSYKEDVVLDPFSGAGTTALVAKKLGRNFIGIEISKNYYEISLRRLNEADSLFQGGKNE